MDEFLKIIFYDRYKKLPFFLRAGIKWENSDVCCMVDRVLTLYRTFVDEDEETAVLYLREALEEVDTFDYLSEEDKEKRKNVMYKALYLIQLDSVLY